MISKRYDHIIRCVLILSMLVGIAPRTQQAHAASSDSVTITDVSPNPNLETLHNGQSYTIEYDVTYDLASQPNATLEASVLQMRESSDEPTRATTIETQVSAGTDTRHFTFSVTIADDASLVLLAAALLNGDEQLAITQYDDAYWTDLAESDYDYSYTDIYNLLTQDLTLPELRQKLDQIHRDKQIVLDEMLDYIKEVAPDYEVDEWINKLTHALLVAFELAAEHAWAFLQAPTAVTVAIIAMKVITIVWAVTTALHYGWNIIEGSGLFYRRVRLEFAYWICYYRYLLDGGELLRMSEPNGGEILSGEIYVSASTLGLWADISRAEYEYSINSTDGSDGDWYHFKDSDGNLSYVMDPAGGWLVQFNTVDVGDADKAWIRVRAIDEYGNQSAWDVSDSWFQISQGAGLISSIIPSFDKETYVPGETVQLAVRLEDDLGNPIADADVSYTVDGDPQVYSMAQIEPGTYQDDSFTAPPGNTSHTIYINAVKGTDQKDMAVSLLVVDLADGHDLAIDDISLNRSDAEPGDQIRVSAGLRNFGEDDETRVSIHTRITGPGSYSWSASHYVGTVVKNGSWGTGEVASWTAPSVEGYYTIQVEAVGISGDEDPSNNVMKVGLYVGQGDPRTYAAYEYKLFRLTWSEDIQAPGYPWTGTYGPVTVSSSHNSAQYTVYVPDYNSNYFYLAIERDGTPLPNIALDSFRRQRSHYFDGNELLIAWFLSEHGGGVILAIGYPNESISINPEYRNIPVGGEGPYQITVPTSHDYDSPVVVRANDDDPPDLYYLDEYSWSISGNGPGFTVYVPGDEASDVDFAFDTRDTTIGQTNYLAFAKAHIYEFQDLPPTVSITSPGNGEKVKGKNLIQVYASDDTGVSSVKFYINDAWIKTDTEARYDCSWDTAHYSNGARVDIRALAFDQSGQTTSDQIYVTVYNAPANEPPSITLLTPNNDEEYGRFIIHWEDEDPDDNAVISLYYDSNSSGYDGTLIQTFISENWSLDSWRWDISDLPTGNSYWVYARIDDGVNPPVYDYSPGPLTIVEPSIVDRFDVVGVEMEEDDNHDGDGVPDAGEEIDLDIGIYNKTTQQQCVLKGFLSTSTPGVTITDDSTMYMSPKAGETKWLGFGFETIPTFDGAIDFEVRMFWEDCSSGEELQEYETVQITIHPNDTTPPVITSGPSTPVLMPDSAIVTWTTDEASTSVVEYGTTPAYGQTFTREGMATDHSVNLRGLQSNTPYYYRVNSADASSNGPTQATGEFTTTVSGSGGLHVDFYASSIIFDFAPALEWDGTYLWAVTRDDSGYALQKIDPATGNSLFYANLDFVSDPQNRIRGLAWDGSYFWVADRSDEFLYKIDTAGTLVGTIAIAIEGPNGLTWDGSHLWVSDIDSQRIFKVAPSGEVLSWIDSPGILPCDLAWDGAHLWNADATLDRIYKISTGGQVLASYPGYGDNPYGLAFDVTGSYLWSSDTHTEAIYRSTLQVDNDEPTVVAGPEVADVTATSAVIAVSTNECTQVWINYGLTASYGYTAATRSYATEHTVPLVGLDPGTTYHYRVRAVDMAGNGPMLGSDHTFATGTDTAMFVVDSFHFPIDWEPWAIAWVNGDMWVFDEADEDDLQRLDVSNLQILQRIWTDEAYDISRVWGLTFDGTYLWFSKTTGDDEILKIRPSDGEVMSRIPAPDGSPSGLAWADGFLWCADASGDRIRRLNPSNGDVSQDFPSPASTPAGLAWDGTYLWVLTTSNNMIYTFDPSNGQVVGAYPALGTEPFGLAWDGSHIWSSDYQEGVLYRYDPGSTASPSVARVRSTDLTSGRTGEFYSLGSVVRVWVQEQYDRVGLTGTISITSITDDPGINGASLVDYGDGKYYYDWYTAGRASANDYHVEVRLSDGVRQDPDGLERNPDISITLATHLSALETINIDPSISLVGFAWAGNDLWVTSSSGYPEKVCKVDPVTGQPITSWDAPNNGYDSSTEDLAWDGSDLWLCNDYSGPEITRHNTSGSILTRFDFPGSDPGGITWDGSNLWIADHDADEVIKVSTSGARLAIIEGPLWAPYGLTYKEGHLWVNESINGRMYEVTTAGDVVGSYVHPGFSHLDVKGSDLWARSGQSVVRLGLKPDLALSPLTLGESTPEEGQSITLSVDVYAYNLPADDVVVQFFLGDPDAGGTQIGSDQLLGTVEPGSPATAQVIWLPGEEGSAALHARVDPSNLVDEYNENNNAVSQIVFVEDSDPLPPAISDAMVVEDPASGASDGDGQVEDNEQPLFYWTATDEGTGVSETTLSISGSDYVGLGSQCPSGYEAADRYCVILTNSLPEGTHTYTITAKDNSFEVNNWMGDFTVLPHSTAVLSTVPEDGATDVNVGTQILARMSPPLQLDQGGAESPSGAVTVTVKGEVVPSSVAWDATEQALLVEPYGELENSAAVTVTLASDKITDVYGNQLEVDYTWSFNTEPDTTPPVVLLTAPEAGETGRGMVSIYGTAFDQNLKTYSVYVGAGVSPSSWTAVATGSQVVVDALLASWDSTSYADETWTIRLVVTDTVDLQSDAEVTIQVDNTPPSNPELSSPSHEVGVWSPENVVTVEWSGASDDMTGVAGFAGLWSDSTEIDVPGLIQWDSEVSSVDSPSLEDGDSWYFLLKTRDGAGNWSSAADLGPFKIGVVVPDAIVGAGDGKAAPGGSVTVPVTATVPSGSLGAATVEVRYDPVVLDATACSANPAGTFDAGICNPGFENDGIDPDVVRFNVISASGVSGDLLLAEITFQAVGQVGDIGILDVEIMTFTDPGGDQIAVRDEDGDITIDRLGDVNCDGSANVVDALFILQYDVGLRDPSDECPPPQDTLFLPQCDVNEDDTCNVIDALFILQCDVGIPNALCPAAVGASMYVHGNLRSNTMLDSSDATVSIGSGEVDPGDDITVLVTADIPAGSLGAATIEVRYDPDVLDATSCNLDPDGVFDAGFCNPDFDNDGINPDIVRFNVASISGVSSSFLMANITFQAVGQSEDSSVLDVEILAFADPGGNPIQVSDQDGEVCIRPCEPIADLAIAKSDDPDPVIAGNTLTYTLSITNTGPSDATGVIVTDTLPAEVDFVSATPRQGGPCGEESGIVTCSLGSLIVGNSITLTIVVTVDSSTTGTLTNTATVIANESDANTGNNTIIEDTTVNQADLVITSAADSGPGTLRQALLNAQNGDTITFDTTVFPPTSPMTIALSSALPNIGQGNLMIDASNAGVILDGSGIGTAPETVLLDDVSLTLDGGPNLITNGDFTAGLGHWRPWDEHPGATRAINSSDFTSSPNSYEWSSVAHTGDTHTVYDTTDTSDPFDDWPYDDGSTVWIPATGGSTAEVRFWYRYGGVRARLRALFPDGHEEEIDNWWFDWEDVWTEAVVNEALPGDAVGVALELEFYHPESWTRGLSINSNSNTIRGLQIINFPFDGMLVIDANENVIGGDRGLGDGPLGQGNLISANGGHGIQICGESATNQVLGNSIGTDLSGGLPMPNVYSGVALQCSPGPHDNIIGGTTTDTRNLISGNGEDGVSFREGAHHNIVIGNHIGTDVNGTTALSNKGNGIAISDSASHNRIGGSAVGERNLISGNDFGVSIHGSAAHNTVVGNYIGTDASGTIAIGNRHGVGLDGGASYNTVGGSESGQGNLISGNDQYGVNLWSGAHDNIIIGNLIGTDVSGTAALGNGYQGIGAWDGVYRNRIGGTTSSEGNIISGNGQWGVQIADSGTISNTVIGNYIGTDVSGMLALPNAWDGVAVHNGAQFNSIGGDTAEERNIISGYEQNGAQIWGTNTMSNTVSGNYIGTDASGTAAVPNGENGISVSNGAKYNVIGGSNATSGGACTGDCNLVSGNGGSAIRIDGTGTMSNTISGNYIGADATGTVAIPNAGFGVFIADGASYNLIGGSNASPGGACSGECNLISGNDDSGVFIRDSDTTNNTVSGNYIGTNASGTLPLGNDSDGVSIREAANNVIGGPSDDERNIITYNDGNGISIHGDGAVSNAIQNNWIGFDADSTGGLDPRDLVVAEDGTVFLADFGRGIFKSTDSAASWQAMNNGLPTLNIEIVAASPDFATDQRLWAWGDGQLFVSDDAGANWLLLSDALPGGLNALESSPHYPVNQTLLSAVEGQGIYKSTDGGSSWEQIYETDNVDNIAFSPNFATDQVVLVGKQWYGVLRSTDGGDTWVESNTGLTDISVYDLAFASDGQTVLLVSDNCGNDGVYRSTDGGQTWSSSGDGLGDCGSEWQVAVSPDFISDGIAFAAEDQMFRSSDGGSTWNRSGDGVFGSRAYALAFSPDFAFDETAYFANFAGVFRTTDAGEHWIWAGANLGDRGNSGRGVEICCGAGTNQVLDNVIGRNGSEGVSISDSEAAGSLVDGNLVGLAPDGVTRAGNGGTNIRIDTPCVTVTNNTSSAGSHGGLRSGTSAHHLTITGNRFGTDVSGTIAVGNSYDGLSLESSWDTVRDNIISGNWGVGIWASENVSSSVFAGNLIGVDASGSVALPNEDGFDLSGSCNTIGGSMPADRNIISGNDGSGIRIGARWAGLSQFPDLTSMTPSYVGVFPMIDFPDTSGPFISSDGITPTNDSGEPFYDMFAARFTGTIHFSLAGDYHFTLGSDDGSLLYIDDDLMIDRNYLTGFGTSETTVSMPAGDFSIEIDYFENQGSAGLLFTADGPGTVTLTTNGSSGLQGEFFELDWVLAGGSDNLVIGNYIGTDATGMLGIGNSADGVYIEDGAHDNTIGGTTTGERNLISGNRGGIAIEGAHNNRVVGNYIGLDVTGTGTVLGGDWSGVYIAGGSTGNTVGGIAAGERNVIAGQGSDGVTIRSSGTMNNTIISNYIGTDATGIGSFGNNEDGVDIAGGPQDNAVEYNVIAANGAVGVRIWDTGTMNNAVSGNYIGTDASGTMPLGNGGEGVHVSGGASYNTVGGSNASPGGSCSGECNLVSGNAGGAIHIDGAGTMSNTISGNYIGTDVTGYDALSNGPGNAIEISWEASNNTVGGLTPAERNIVSGNQGFGIVVNGGHHNTISGNYVGVDVSGIGALGNGSAGVGLAEGGRFNLIGGDTPEAGNVIANNGWVGIYLHWDNTDYNQIKGNLIESNDHSGIEILGDGASGPEHNVIEGAIIHANGSSGITIQNGPAYNTVTQNSIYDNGGLGISLVPHANNDMVRPIVISFNLAAGTASGWAPAGSTVEVFSDDEDEGRVYEGSTTADGDGNWSFDKGSALAGPNITATATDTAGNTSPFGTVCYDFDGNGTVDVGDIMAVASRWRAKCGDPDPRWPSYDPLYDIDGDCDIDVVDIMKVVVYWGQSCTSSAFGDLIRTIPTPADGAQGLAWDGSNLWVVWGDIFKVNPINGSLLAQIPGPAGDLQGLTWDGSALWCVSYAEDYIYQLNPSDGSVLNSFPSPGLMPIGIAWDGAYLWNSDEDGTFYKLDPSDGSVVSSAFSPLGSSTTMLDWDGQNLWASMGGQFYQLDISNWQILKSIHVPAAFPKGIAWNGANLWNGGFEDDTLYLLDATPAGASISGRVQRSGLPISGKEMYIVKNSNTSDEMQVGWMTTDGNGQYDFTVDPDIEYELRGFGDMANNEFQELVMRTTPSSGNPDVILPDVDIWYDGLLGPADGATFNRDQVNAGNPIPFSWSPKTGATEYAVWLRQHDDWSYVVWNSASSTDTAVDFDGTTNHGIHLPAMQYDWHVGMGLDSGWWAWSEHRLLNVTSTPLVITVDGNPADWAAAVPIATDAAGDNVGGPAGTDFGHIRSYVDDTDIYLLVEVHDPDIVYEATIELNLDYKPGKSGTWESTADLHTNIWNGGINAWTGDMEPYPITGAQVAFGQAMEIRIARDQLENTSYAIPTFVNVWTDGIGWDPSTFVP